MSLWNPSAQERRGILVLCAVTFLFAVVAVLSLWRNRDAQDAAQAESDADSSMAWTGGRGRTYARRQPRPYSQGERVVETFPFDPNTVDSTTLLRLGLTPSMVRGIYRFRQMGYVYSEPDDFQGVPGMTRGMWERLRPCIVIGDEFKRVVRDTVRSEHKVAESQPRSNKLAPGSTIGLNGSDTTALQRVPHIGPYLARQIAYRRQQLGGFYSVQQLLEIEELPEDVLPYFHLDSVAVRRIDVNHCTRRQLTQHPYIRVRLAKPLWNYLQKRGSLHDINDLRRIPDFTDQDIQRLTPYLEFR